MGHVGTKVSWHNQYRDSAWCFFGGMPFELTEGDIICIFEQYKSFNILLNN
jgi:RNA-binding motif protein, X-linked 2